MNLHLRDTQFLFYYLNLLKFYAFIEEIHTIVVYPYLIKIVYTKWDVEMFAHTKFNNNLTLVALTYSCNLCELFMCYVNKKHFLLILKFQLVQK